MKPRLVVFITLCLSLLAGTVIMKDFSMAAIKNKASQPLSTGVALSDGTCLTVSQIENRQLAALKGDEQAALDLSAHYAVCTESEIESLFWLKTFADKGNKEMQYQFGLTAVSLEPGYLSKLGKEYLLKIKDGDDKISIYARQLLKQKFENAD
jgi:hypothetical protein